MAKLTQYTVSIPTPFGPVIQGTWVPSDQEREAAWEM